MSLDYYTPDLTGSNTACSVTNDIYTLVGTNQKIEFRTTIYKETLQIVVVDGIGKTFLTEGTDWEVQDEDRDWTTQSRLANVSSTLTLTPIKQITIIRPQTNLPVKTAFSYQTVYYTGPDSSTSANMPINITPDYMAELARRLSAVESLTAKVADSTAGTSSTPLLLDFDINETNSANLITESYLVNTFSGINLIRPLQGSFFKDSVVIVDPISKYTLKEGTDYLIVGLDNAKTKLTANVSGIYFFIQILYQFAGSLDTTYHAVGGDVSQHDLRAAISEIVQIKGFLDGSGFLTNDSIDDTDVINSIKQTLVKQGDKLRLLLSGKPLYNTATGNGTAVKKPILAPDTDTIHWFPIASLYKVSGSATLCLADRFCGHVEVVGAGVIMDIAVTVNFNAPNNPVVIETSNEMIDAGFTPYGTYSPTITPVLPSVRVVWNEDTNSDTGCVIEVGLILTAYRDTLVVIDNSGVESCWMLDRSNGVGADGTTVTPITPSDSGFVLPDGVTTWTNKGYPSKVVSKLVGPDIGYMVYQGLTSLSKFDSTQKTAQALSNILLTPQFDITCIKEIVLYLQDSNNIPFTATIPVSAVSSASPVIGKGQIILSDTQMSVATVTLTTTDTAVSMVLQLGAEVDINAPTSLRYVVAKV